MSTSHEVGDEALPLDRRLRARADGYGGAVTCQDTQQQSESQGNHQLHGPSAHFFVVTGAQTGDRTGLRPRSCSDVSDDGVVIGRGSGDTPTGTTFDDPRMSRAHARLARGPSGWQLIDLQSRNGSAVNGARLEPRGRAALADGAVIRMGDTLLVFREGPAPAEEPQRLAGLGAGLVAGLTAVVGDAERGAFPGISAAAHVIRRRVARLAVRTGHVLVLGETGTGKERVARAMAPHSKMPFEVQNCAELHRELARSELFGHLRGAFTGAHSNRTGLVELAGDGVLFLDELGELPLEVQGELLRFLEDGMFRPVGSMELRKSRARIVAATNVDLDEAVRRGTFRRDLLARLRASNEPLQLPPLRHRREDVLDWTRAFALELHGGAPEPGPDQPANQTPRPPPGRRADPLWTASALECLLLYPWPENLRELRGVVRELCDAHPEGAIRSEDLPERVRAHREQLRAQAQQSQQATTAARAPGAASAAAGWPPALPPPVSEPSEEEIKRVLKEHKGNVRMCAELLSMERTKLYRRCGKLGIDIEKYRDP